MKTRFTVAGLHLLGSAVVISLALSAVYCVWYPKPFYIIHSVFDAVKIALAVDLVLGPFLTLIIFNVAKPRSELIRDISIIVVFQIVALSWGLHITYKMRPEFLVFQGGTFYSIIKKEINVDELSENVSLPTVWQQPKLIYIEPLSSQQAIERMDDVLKGGEIIGEMYQAKKYRPLSIDMESQYMQDVIKHATSYTTLLKSKTWKTKVERFLASAGGAGEDYMFYSLENAIQFSGIIIFNKKDFSYAGLIY